MIPFAGSILIVLLVVSGGLIEDGYPAMGLLSLFIGSVGMGLLFAAVQTIGRRNAALAVGFEMPKGLTVHGLIAYIIDRGIDTQTAIYVGDQGINPASAAFHCLLDDRQALVIERKSE